MNLNTIKINCTLHFVVSCDATMCTPHKKRKFSLIFYVRVQNFKSGNLVVILLAQTFVELSHPHFDSSFSSTDHKLSTFDTDYDAD